jgi:SHS2 domain-containing protein
MDRANPAQGGGGRCRWGYEVTGDRATAAASGAARGHRLGPHTADYVIEAWGPDRPTCLVEAMKALVEVFATIDSSVTARRSVPVSTGPAADTDLLVSVLEEVIYVTEVLGEVPVRFHLADTEDGGVAGAMEVADATEAVLVGPIPKAVSYHGLEMAERAATWHCRAVVDV